MEDFSKYDVSSELLEVMMQATYFSSAFLEEEISTADVILAAINQYGSAIQQFFEKKNEVVYAEEIVNKITGDKKLYETIFDYDYKHYRKEKKVAIGKVILQRATVEYDERMKLALDEADELCKKNGYTHITLDALVLCILKNTMSVGKRLLEQFFSSELIAEFVEEEKLKFDGVKKDNEEEGFTIPKAHQSYIEDITAKYLNKSGSDVLGREDEIYDLFITISKMTKKGVVLIGPPGAGKSAIMEEVACRILAGTCHKKFTGWRVLSLSMNGMVAGTKYRGEFEEKVESLFNFIKKNKNIIVFVDELHQVLGAGSADGESGPSFSSSIKPLLARDDMVLIGATTPGEYAILERKDPAFCRRMRKIEVKEPKHSEVKPMIQAKVKTLAGYHGGIAVSDEVLDAVIINASSFSNIANPDRTLDLLDMALAVASDEGAHELTIEHIKKVYATQFRKYRDIPADKKKSTAMHEAGHFVRWYISETKVNEDCILISNVPDYDWLGVNIFEEREIPEHSRNHKYLKEYVAIALAGRVAQRFYEDEIDSGASEDLRMATEMVENYFLLFGTEDGYKNYSFATGNLPISDKTSDEIRLKVVQYINDVYTETESLLANHKDGIIRVAELLESKGIITSKEAEEAFNASNN